MAAPPALSIREQIFVDLKTTLEGITQANGYAWDIGTVSRGQLAPLETSLLPLAGIMPAEDPPEYRPGTLHRRLLFATRLWVDVTLAAETASGLEALIADVQLALRVDPQRSGLAEDTREAEGIGIKWLYLPGGETLAGADIFWEIDYKTALNSPLAGPD